VAKEYEPGHFHDRRGLRLSENRELQVEKDVYFHQRVQEGTATLSAVTKRKDVDLGDRGGGDKIVRVRPKRGGKTTSSKEKFLSPTRKKGVTMRVLRGHRTNKGTKEDASSLPGEKEELLTCLPMQ